VDTKTLVDIFVRHITIDAGNAAGQKFMEVFNFLKLGYAEEIKEMLGSL
jgi:hypothetical protein